MILSTQRRHWPPLGRPFLPTITKLQSQLGMDMPFITSPKIGTHLLRQSLLESLEGERSLLSGTAFQLCCFLFATKDKRENDILFGKNSDEGKGIFLSSCKPWRALVKPHICNHFSSCRISSFNPPRFPSSRKHPQ